LDAPLSAFGEAATVTRPAPNDTAISTSVIWHGPADEPQPYGHDLARRDPRRVMTIPRSDVAEAPKGTLIDAAELDGGPVKRWMVDGYAHTVDPEFHRVFVVRVP
jgi:hypothetical protein